MCVIGQLFLAAIVAYSGTNKDTEVSNGEWIPKSYSSIEVKEPKILKPCLRRLARPVCPVSGIDREVKVTCWKDRRPW